MFQVSEQSVQVFSDTKSKNGYTFQIHSNQLLQVHNMLLTTQN